MTTLADLQRDPNLITHLPKIRRFQFLWYSDFWDGPRSGLLLHRKQKRWFELFAESARPDFYQRFAVIELTEAQLSEEEAWHKLFRAKVGTHTDYGKNGPQLTGRLKPRAMWAEFYEPYAKRKPQDFSKNLVIGWFEV